MSWIPEEPTSPEAQRASGAMPLRFEDVSQDGRLVLEAIPHALTAVWRRFWSDWRADLLPTGTLPIMSRAVVENGDGPISAGAKVDADGSYHLWHTTGPDGAVDRVLLGMWSQIRAPIGRTYGPPPQGAGEPTLAGRVFCEHVFTRPLGPPGDRRVTRLDRSGSPWLPSEERAWQPAEAAIELPEGASPLDPALSLDPMIIAFGIDHTDSNHHVNSLVYTRLFIEAALRRLAVHGRRGPLFARSAEIAYRRPCFAGERAQIASRAFSIGERAGIVAVLLDEREAASPLEIEKTRPRCFARLILGD